MPPPCHMYGLSSRICRSPNQPPFQQKHGKPIYPTALFQPAFSPFPPSSSSLASYYRGLVSYLVFLDVNGVRTYTYHISHSKINEQLSCYFFYTSPRTPCTQAGLLHVVVLLGEVFSFFFLFFFSFPSLLFSPSRPAVCTLLKS